MSNNDPELTASICKTFSKHGTLKMSPQVHTFPKVIATSKRQSKELRKA